ncbi:hypothetical protein KP003_17335 [Geomonas nitrogeniifigens]|uniref:Uncharacterized protein n=1 Tax=Geomonas diazotrophica TaxID=2843197 RepID=A0ABX8JH49_9BACT|nr:hypothetical protein [Geomonas nitrogeniifigens]QWV96929.1 hypothetical protein KP005_16485 [Geomonas nitrogeniifigens]QXE86105.1 hypothetical protein KP003_17335 [Geomonas nitrogeniifigens]
MWLKLFFCFFLVVFPVAMVVAQDDKPAGPVTVDPNVDVAAAAPAGAADPEAKMVGGMSILGNKEAPMSLFIVPWKTSELGAETSLARTLTERQVPVDRDVFLREVAFYEVSTGNKVQAAGSRTN